MGWTFEEFELDAAAFELRKSGESLQAEPQVISLLLFLVEHRGRLVTKDEIIDEIWDGRAISDTALSSRIKSARQLLGDDGKQQRLIKTVHGKGFRFVGDVNEPSATALPAATASLHAEPNRHKGADQKNDAAEPGQQSRPSVAVLPFRTVGVAGPYSHMAEALPHEVITELARLRWLFVIARGSSFRFHSGRSDMAEVGTALGVRYCLSGVIEFFGERIEVSVELADTRDSGVVWADRFSTTVDGIHELRRKIIVEIISALEVQIPLNEARRAQLTAPQHLDAWGMYHLGVEQMFQFSASGNAQALAFFEKAVAKEPGFARAHAGLSFAHYQDVFLGHTTDRSRSVKATLAAAERAIERDPLDPFVNLVKGRSFWLERDVEGSQGWLTRAVQLSPSYAQGQYAKSCAEVLLGHVEEAIADSDLAMRLSPLDPMLSAMCGVRAGAHSLRSEYAEAAKWAEKGASAPGTHGILTTLTALYHHLGGNPERANAWAGRSRRELPNLTKEGFLRSLPFSSEMSIKKFEKALDELGYE